MVTRKEPAYSNREIDEKWQDIANSLSRIEIQTTTTNGRVKTLEKWMYLVMGGTGVLSLIVIPILSWALFTLVNIDSKVHAAVDEALSAYQVSP